MSERLAPQRCIYMSCKQSYRSITIVTLNHYFHQFIETIFFLVIHII